MVEKNIIQEFRLKNIHDTINYLIEEINRNKLISNNTKRFVQLYITLNTFLFSVVQLPDVFRYLLFLP